MLTLRRGARIAATAFVALVLLWIALVSFESGGGRPVRGIEISSNQTTVVQNTTTTDNPNAGCKPKPPHDCRPSG
jgi:hypothetical protein